MFHLLVHYFNPDRAKENESDLEDVFFKEVCTDGRMDPEKVLAYHLPKNQKEDKRLFRLLCNYFNAININMLSRPNETTDVLFNLLTTEGRMDPAKLLSYLAISKSSHLRFDPDTGLIIPWYADTSDEEPEESVEDVKESPKEESEEDATADVEESEESSDAEEEPISEDSSDEEELPHLYLNEIQHRHSLDPRTFPKYHKGLSKYQFEELLKECLTDLPKTDDDPTMGYVFEKMIDKMAEKEYPQDPAFGAKLRRLAKKYAKLYNVEESNELGYALLLMVMIPRGQYNEVRKIIREYIVGVGGYPKLNIGNLGLHADAAIDTLKKLMHDSMIEWSDYIDKYRTTDYLRNPFYQHGRYIYVPEETGVHPDEMIDEAFYCIKTPLVSPDGKMNKCVKIIRAYVEPSGGNRKFDDVDSSYFRKYITVDGAVYMEEIEEVRTLSELEEQEFSMLDDQLFHRMITAWVITKRTETADLYVPSGEEAEEE